MRYRSDDPRLQKAQQKIAAIPPEDRAIYDDSMAVAGWARDDMLRQLKLSEIGQSVKRQKGQLGLKRKGLALSDEASRKSYRLEKRQAYQSEKEFKYGQKQAKYATALSAATFMGGKYLDYKKYKTDKMVAEAKLSSAQRLNKPAATTKPTAATSAFDVSRQQIRKDWGGKSRPGDRSY